MVAIVHCSACVVDRCEDCINNQPSEYPKNTIVFGGKRCICPHRKPLLNNPFDELNPRSKDAGYD